MSFKDSLKAFSATPERDLHQYNGNIHLVEAELIKQINETHKLYHKLEVLRAKQEKHITHLWVVLTWVSICNIFLLALLISSTN
jgi:hypothetical protein